MRARLRVRAPFELWLVRAYLVLVLVILLIGGILAALDYAADAPYRDQHDRCIANGGGRLCDGLKVD